MTLERVAITGATHHQLDLTPRERAILCLIAGGLTTSQAAARLHISRHTAAQHIAAMLRRTQARSRGELIARAYASGTLAAGAWPPRAEADQSA
jgi:DNA-binding CsgD family transcriptional regulator